jgi:hypothetical protein
MAANSAASFEDCSMVRQIYVSMVDRGLRSVKLKWRRMASIYAHWER